VKRESGDPGEGARSVKTRLATAILLLFGTPALAGGIRGTCDIRFLGSSTLHDFTGTGRCMPFSAPLARDAAGKIALSLVEVEVPVAEMRTGIGVRDGKMRDMFEADRYPAIRAAARGIDAEALRERMRGDPEGKAPLEITLAIRDVERTIVATAMNLKAEGNHVSFEVAFPVSLKEFGLPAPSFLGIVRVSDQVAVSAKFTLDVTSDP
jgi:hypothetical protein